MDGLFALVPVIVVGAIIFAIGTLIFTTVSNLSEDPISRETRIVGKRQNTSVSGGMNDTPSTSSTSYYLTFEFGDGSREEFSVSATEYGLVVEGDAGTLHSQGTWFKGFDRSRAV